MIRKFCKTLFLCFLAVLLVCYQTVVPTACSAQSKQSVEEAEIERDETRPAENLFSQPGDKPDDKTVNEDDLVALMELNVIGKTQPTKDSTVRLSEVERHVFGSQFDDYAHEVKTRVSQIYQEAPPSDELYDDWNEKTVKEPAWFKKSNSVCWRNSLVQRTALLELHTYNKVNHRTLLAERITLLERDALGKSKKKTGNLNDRVNALMSELQPPDTLIDQVINAGQTNWDWFLRPPALSFFKGKPNSKPPSNRLRNFGRETASGIKRLLCSPTLWQALVAGGILYGTIELARRGMLPMGYPVYGYNNSLPALNRGGSACTGAWDCRICDNCSSCMHCNSGLSPCGKYSGY
jgi:hypothetical protein